MELSKIQEKSRFDKICDFEWCYTVTLTRIMYMMLFVDTSSLNIEYEQLNRKYSKGWIETSTVPRKRWWPLWNLRRQTELDKGTTLNFRGTAKHVGEALLKSVDDFDEQILQRFAHESLQLHNARGLFQCGRVHCAPDFKAALTAFPGEKRHE